MSVAGLEFQCECRVYAAGRKAGPSGGWPPTARRVGGARRMRVLRSRTKQALGGIGVSRRRTEPPEGLALLPAACAKFPATER